VLGFIDKDSAYAIPNEAIEKILADLYKTPQRHWHIVLEDSEGGGVELSVPNGTRMPLRNFELKLD
jgi:hypothetical protein